MSQMSLPPGFRFHPTDDELVGYYLKRKVDGLTIELEVIPVIDLYKFDPWELPDKSFLPKRDMEWFFFCPRDRKYPNGSRTNRATGAGYWKATGKDRKIVCESSVQGLRKTLVFYRGRAPGGERTDWVMHEYRLCEDLSQGTPNFLGAFALCRVVKRHEHGQKASDLQGESKAKKSILSAISLKKCVSKVSSSPEENPSHATDLFERCNAPNPITSPSEIGKGAETEPFMMDTAQTSLWGSNVLSDASQPFSLEDYISSGSIIRTEFPNSAQEYNLSPVSSDSTFTVEAYLADELSGNACLPSFPSPAHCMGIYSDCESMELQTLGWNPPQFMNPTINGIQAWNPAVPTICRQASEGEEANLWLQEDNLVIVI